MKIRIGSTGGPPSAQSDESQPAGSSGAHRWWDGPRSRVSGDCRHGQPAALACRRLDHSDRRPEPAAERLSWAATLAAILTATCVLGLTALHSMRWAAPLRAAGLVTAAALLAIAGFFTALGTEDLLATLASTPRFLSNNEAITSIGTLTGSILTLILTPLGLAVIGIATFRSGLLSRTGRLSAVAVAPCLVLGALVSAASTSAPSPQPGCRYWPPAGSLLGRDLLRSRR